MNVFSYIVTIHNSGDLIYQTLANLFENRYYAGEVIAVLDGCTDNSESEVDRFVREQNVRITKLHAPDVHEILSINLALAYIQEHSPTEYVVTVQDDCWLQDPDLEYMTLSMFRDHPQLAHLVFRMGTNYTPDFQLVDLCENYCGAGFGTTLALHQWGLRMAGCKSPSAIPMWFVEKYGPLDVNLAPRSYDDIELSLRALSLGYETIVLATKWRSDLTWGGTRRTQQPVVQQDAKNAEYVKTRYKWLLDTFVIPEDYRKVHNYNE